MIKNFEPRIYQQTIFNTCTSKNTLVVLPTGMGKTNIFLMLAAYRLRLYPQSKILFIGPTRPLIDQYLEVFKKHFEIEENQMAVFTGYVQPEKRAELWKTAKIIFSTPQGLENDVISGRIGLEDVSLLGIDEAHRAVGDYSYVWLAQQYIKKAKYPRILALTASPGSDVEKIEEVCKNLSIEHIEVRTDNDPDVRPYVQDIKIEWVKVTLPIVFKDAEKYLTLFLRERMEKLRKWGILHRKESDLKYVSKTDLLKLQAELRGRAASGERDFVLWNAISLLAEIMKIQHAVELLETQGISALHKYFEKLQKEAITTKTKAIKNLTKDVNYRSALIKIERLFSEGIQHPKLIELQKIIEREIKANKDVKIIVFNQYRDNALEIVNELNKLEGVRVKLFVGQAKKEETGLSQKEQKQILDKFREGEFNVLVATSVDPDEYIILKNPGGVIELRKIGEFVDSFVKCKTKVNPVSKKIKGWWVLSTNDRKTDFYPITEVHKHKRQSKVVNVVLNSGFRCLVTEDHSLFTFNKEGETIATKPEKDKFVSIAYSAPNIEEITKVDIIQELSANAPKKILKKLFCSFNGINQPKMRMYSTELRVLSKLNKNRFKTELSKVSKLNLSTITNSTKRLEESGFIKSFSRKGYVFCEITKLGKEYLNFLTWFFKYQYYHKRKYRVSLKNVANAPKDIHKFCDIRVGVWYGKTTVLPFLELNEYLAELLGWYVAEGHAKHTKNGSEVYLASRKRKIRKRMAECIVKGLYLKPSITWRGVASNSQISHHLIKYVFKCGIGAYNKEIPNVIFSAPTKQKLKFLEGYFLGDGNVSKDRITFTTVSRKLAVGLIFLLKQLGIKNITLRKDHCYRICVYESLPFAKIKNKKSNKTYYSTTPVALMSKEEFKKYGNFYVNMQKKRGACRTMKKPGGAICFDYIKKIEKTRKQPRFVYDISVNGTERFFGGAGLICLHNSIGEEGLDVPQVGIVIFYEPIPSAIRTIQRRGRTGRHEAGRVIVLMALETRDVGYKWSAHHKEKRMYRTLDKIKRKLMVKFSSQPILEKYIPEEDKIKVIVDHREKGSGVMKELMELGASINLEKIDNADYLLSSRVGVELKTAEDFVNSLIDGRLLEQIKNLKSNFERPLVIVEGEQDIYSVRNVHPNAIRGMLSTIAISYGIPILFTKNSKETASFLKIIAKREQEGEGSDFTLHGEKKEMPLKEWQEFIISALPGVGSALSRPLLREFKSVKNIVNANEEELQNVEKIGPVKAKRIKEVTDSEYKI